VTRKTTCWPRAIAGASFTVRVLTGWLDYRSFNYWDANHDRPAVGPLRATDLANISSPYSEYHPQYFARFRLSRREIPCARRFLGEALRRIASHKTVVACSAISMCDRSLRGLVKVFNTVRLVCTAYLRGQASALLQHRPCSSSLAPLDVVLSLFRYGKWRKSYGNRCSRNLYAHVPSLMTFAAHDYLRRAVTSRRHIWD